MSQDYTRFTLSQRLQHIFMFVPFIILVLTGFPHQISRERILEFRDVSSRRD